MSDAEAEARQPQCRLDVADKPSARRLPAEEDVAQPEDRPPQEDVARLLR